MSDPVLKEWLASLEAERWDISYRRKPPVALKAMEKPRKASEKPPAPRKRQEPPKPARDPQEVAEARKAREMAIYNAGRFAAGARDAEAVEAFKQINQRKPKK